MESLKSHPNKELKIHLIEVAEHMAFILQRIEINEEAYQHGFLKLVKEEERKNFMENIVRIMGLSHDLGKGTSFFQKYLKQEVVDNQKKSHALLSAYLAIYFFRAFLEKTIKEALANREQIIELYALLFSAPIYKHHADFSSIEDLFSEYTDKNKKTLILEQWEDLKKEGAAYFSETLNPAFDKILKNYKWENLQESFDKDIVNFFNNKKYNAFCDALAVLGKLSENEIMENLLYFLLFYSCLIDSDKLSASNNLGIVKNIEEKREKTLQNSNFIKAYQEKLARAAEKSKFNTFRNYCWEEVQAFIKKIDGKLLESGKTFILKLPTGSGKTLLLYQLALKLREKIYKNKKYMARIVYALPFISIIDQNYEVLEKAFLKNNGRKPYSNEIICHTYLNSTTYTEESKEAEEAYDSKNNDSLIFESWNSEIVVTTFVQLFSSIFNGDKNLAMKFHNLFGAIIICDEIQALNFKYYKLFQIFMEVMKRDFNNFFVLSSATVPFGMENYIDIIKGTKFENMKKKLLKRNKIVYSEKNEEEIIPLLLANYKKGNKTIFIGNTINSVNTIFEKLGDIKEKYVLTTRLIPTERLKIINKIKNLESPYILVSTQIIEAGVDLDADYTIRDLAPMDAIIQAAGRVNRNNKKAIAEEILVSILKTKNGKFLSNYIYDTSEIDSTKTILKMKKILQEKEYEEVIAAYYAKLAKEIEYFSLTKLLDPSQDLIGTRGLREIKIIEKKDLLEVNIYVTLDTASKNLLEKYSELLEEYSENKNLDSFLKKDAAWAKLKPAFLKNLVNIKMRSSEELKLNKIGSFYIIDHSGQKNNEDIYYDKDYGVVIGKTGNKDASTSEIW